MCVNVSYVMCMCFICVCVRTLGIITAPQILLVVGHVRLKRINCQIVHFAVIHCNDDVPICPVR